MDGLMHDVLLVQHGFKGLPNVYLVAVVENAAGESGHRSHAGERLRWAPELARE
jgi:hypothetical protein